MKDNKKKKDRRKYPQGSAASHAGQNSGNHGGHAGHPRSRSSKLLKNRKTLLMDLVSSKNYEPMRPEGNCHAAAGAESKTVGACGGYGNPGKRRKNDVISDGRYQKSRVHPQRRKNGKKETAAPESRAKRTR